MTRRSGFPLSVAICLTVCLALIASSASAGDLAVNGAPTSPVTAAAGALQVVGENSLVVEPACNAIAGVRLQLLLRNPSTTGSPVALTLRAEHLTADPAGPLPSATVGIEAVAGGTIPAALAPGESTPIAVVATGWLGPGKWNADLYNDQVSLGSAHFLVSDPFVHLKLQVSDPNQPAITLTRKRTATLLLRNEDLAAYGITWEYWLKDAPPGSQASVSGLLAISANDTAVLTLTPPDAWFGDASTFHDAVADGYFRVQLRSGGSCQTAPQAPAKLFSVATTLVGYTSATKAWCTYSATFVLLFFGAFSSLYINYKLPDDRVRRGLRKRLEGLAIAIERLPKQLASRLRVVVGVERRALGDQLKSLVWWSTDFETTRSRIDDSATKLMTRVGVLARMGQLRARYESMRAGRVPPSLLDRFEDLFEKTVQLLAVLEPPDVRVNAAIANIDAIEAALGSWSQPELAPPQDPPLAMQIVARHASLYEDFQPGGPLDAAAWKSLVAQVPGLDVLRNKPVASTELDPLDYVEKDWVGFIGSLLREYYRLCTQRNPSANDPPVTRQLDLVNMLRTRTWVSLQAARRLVGEMTAGIYAENVEQEIRGKRVEISLENNQLRRFEPGWFGIAFHGEEYDATSQARDEWVPEWNFGHVPADRADDPKHYLTEKGWSVAHYFPEVKNYKVTVVFRRADGTAPSSPLQLSKLVLVGEAAGRDGARSAGPFRALRRWLAGNGTEVVSLLLALSAAVLALAAGAKEQLLKMGPFFGLIAVFLLGFGSDQIKTLLSKKD